VITYGENYGGGRIGEASRARLAWSSRCTTVPSIAPSAWPSSTATATAPAGGATVRRFVKFGYSIASSWPAPASCANIGARRHRPRARRPARADGLLYLLTDEGDGKLVRLVP